MYHNGPNVTVIKFYVFPEAWWVNSLKRKTGKYDYYGHVFFVHFLI